MAESEWENFFKLFLNCRNTLHLLISLASYFYQCHEGGGGGGGGGGGYFIVFYKSYPFDSYVALNDGIFVIRLNNSNFHFCSYRGRFLRYILRA